MALLLLFGVSDVSVGLTGQASTAAAGTLTSVQPLTGQQADVRAGTLRADWHLTAFQGDVDNTATVPLDGAASTTAAGTLVGGQPLTGSESTSASGSLIPGFQIDGSALTSAAGDVDNATAVPLAGEEVTSAAGTLTYAVEGSDVEVALTGEAITAATGDCTGGQPIGGAECTGEHGSLGVTFGPPLEGIGIGGETQVVGNGGTEFIRKKVPVRSLVRSWPRRW